MEHKINGFHDSIVQSKFLNIKDLSTTNHINNNDDDDNDDDIDDNSAHIIELNNRIKNDFMSYCLAFLHEDEEARECTQIVWNKYLQCVGDVSILSAFFDTLSFNIKTTVFPKYQSEIIEWCADIFHLSCHALLYSTYEFETFSRVIRNALKQSNYERNFPMKKAIIYISNSFDTKIKMELLSIISNIKFEYTQNDIFFEDMIDINQLNEKIKRDLNNIESYPFMVIATTGTTVLGRCDELTKIKQICHQNNLWLHVSGDLLGSLALLSTVNENVYMSCDSLTIDLVKLLGIPNLPYLTYFLHPLMDIQQNKQSEFNSIQDDQSISDNVSTISTASTNRSSALSTTTNNDTNSLVSHPFHDLILHNPSIGFLSVWSVSQRCSKDNVLHHMKRSFDLATLLVNRLEQIKTLRILNYNDNHEIITYKRICSGDVPDDPLPKTVILFRFETNDIPEIESLDDLCNYIDLLNLWLFDKLSQQYPKMNLQLLKSVHFQMFKSDNIPSDQLPGYAIRFAPLEHLLDIIDKQGMQAFCDDIQHYNDILLATMTARARLGSSVKKYENIVSIPMPHWAGIGAVRYIPNHENASEKSEVLPYNINAIQAELARKLQTHDSAFSLGGGTNEHDSMFYLRLGMIRKRDDLDVLLQKITTNGKETEIALKYVEDMAEKIKTGIEKVRKDLLDENQQILAQEGLLRQLPVLSNIMSWWSPSSVATKGRSFDLQSGRVESTEDTYVYRMQINKQSPHAPTHNEEISSDTDATRNSTDKE